MFPATACAEELGKPFPILTMNKQKLTDEKTARPDQTGEQEANQPHP